MQYASFYYDWCSRTNDCEGLMAVLQGYNEKCALTCNFEAG